MEKTITCIVQYQSPKQVWGFGTMLRPYYVVACEAIKLLAVFLFVAQC